MASWLAFGAATRFIAPASDGSLASDLSPYYTSTVGKPKRSLTLAVDEDLLRAAKVIAGNQHTTVTQMLRRYLVTLVRAPQREPVEDLVARDRKESEVLKTELSALHHLVTAIMARQVEYLHEQSYDLKRVLYHADAVIPRAAFNGQFSKHQIFAALCSRFSFEAFVETGTYLGGTTEFLASFGKPVYSVDCSPEFHDKANALLGSLPHVHLGLADSPAFLRQLLAQELLRDAMIFFYLDAHWQDKLPLADEIRIVAKHHPHAVIMIDDFKVENDAGYGYDTYRCGQEVTLAFIGPELHEFGWQVFFPILPSALDQNATNIMPPRGTAVLACDPEAIGILKEIKELRHWILN